MNLFECKNMSEIKTELAKRKDFLVNNLIRNVGDDLNE